jgi:2-polyprenyl-3-methyl-5-hydroxy-6-metoxy-1,4-benzoquinol methylase
MPLVNEWREFFDEYAARYMDEPFVVGTVGEVDFVTREPTLPPGGHILEVGCGTGRHTVELARRGYRVTGIDQSQGMLDEATAAARQAGVAAAVEWVRADVTEFRWPGQRFDAAICLCEGAFTLLGATDDPIEHDLRILRSIFAALRPGARVVLTALSAVRKLRQLTPDDVAGGCLLSRDDGRGRGFLVGRRRG